MDAVYAMLGIAAAVALAWLCVKYRPWRWIEDYATGAHAYRSLHGQGLASSLPNVASVPTGAGSLVIGNTHESGYTQPLVVAGNLRTTHSYVVGASGSGKSSLLKNLIIQDIASGVGVVVIDPHGDLVGDLIAHLNDSGRKAWLMDLADTEHMLPYNPLARQPDVLIAEQVAKLVLAFKRVWADSWGPRMEDILRHTLSLLIEHGLTLAEFERLLTDADMREALVEASKNDATKDFFLSRFGLWNAKERQLFVESSLNKVSAFLADPRLGERLASVSGGLNISSILQNSEVLLVNLARGRLAGNADLFGALLLADLEISLMSRPSVQRSLFALYCDEFQAYVTSSFEVLLAEARKFGVGLTIAHQTLSQLDDRLASLVLGNAQTQVYFRVSREDAERLAKETTRMPIRMAQREIAMAARGQERLTLDELWEVAFDELASLEPRHALVTQKGVADACFIRTLDTPAPTPQPFNFDGDYLSLSQLEAIRQERRAKLAATTWSKQRRQPHVSAGSDLSFLEDQE